MRVFTLLLTLGGLALVLPSTSGAAMYTWGSNLSATPNVTTASIAPDGSDLALWNTQLTGTGEAPTAPVGGQVRSVSVKGCAIQAPGAPALSNGAPVNTINFEDLTPKSDGSYSINEVAANFTLPFCSDSNSPSAGAVNTSTITTYQPNNMCAAAGDVVAYEDIGGYVPGYYPNGVPFEVIASGTSGSMDSFSDAQGNSAYSPSSMSFKSHPGNQVMIQVVTGTLTDNGGCPGGTGCENSAGQVVPCGGGGSGGGGGGTGGGGGGTGGGGGGTGGTGGTGSKGAPVLTLLKLNPANFFAAKGATITYKDSQAAVTTFKVYKLEKGIRRGGACVKPPRKRPPHARTCNRRLVVVRTFIHQDKAGGSGVHLSGLKPGSYLLRASATLNGHTSPTVSVSFKVKRP